MKKTAKKYERSPRYESPKRPCHDCGKAGRALADEYAILRPADRTRPLEEFPAVAALLYALAWLELTAWGAGKARKPYVAATTAGY